MTSAIDSPRRCFAEISPMTQRTASMMFDLPQPFGPTTPTRLVGKPIAVGSTKDLNPASLILVRRIDHPRGTGREEEARILEESVARHSTRNAARRAPRRLPDARQQNGWTGASRSV